MRISAALVACWAVCLFCGLLPLILPAVRIYASGQIITLDALLPNSVLVFFAAAIASRTLFELWSTGRLTPYTRAGRLLFTLGLSVALTILVAIIAQTPHSGVRSLHFQIPAAAIATVYTLAGDLHMGKFRPRRR